jgi:hypothetical protein
VQTAVPDVEQAHVVRSAVGVGRGRVAAPVVAAIDDEPGRARLPHFSERDLLLALYRSAYSTGRGKTPITSQQVATEDHAAINAGFDFRLYAMKPTPAKPSSIMAHC